MGRSGRPAVPEVDAASLAVIWFCVATICVAILALLVPPFQNSDEVNHFDRVDQISRGGLVAKRYAGPDTSGGRVDIGIYRIDVVTGHVRFHPDQKISGAMLRAAGAERWGTPASETFANTSVYSPLLYAPEVLGVLLGKAADLSILHTLMLSRMAGGMFAILICTFAIAISGSVAPFLAVILSLPMSLSLFASVSQDGPMLAIAALVMALVQSWSDRDLPMTAARLTAIAGGLSLLAIGRPAYLPLIAIVILVGRASIGRRLAAAALAAMPPLLWSAVAARTAMINTYRFRGSDPVRQMRLLLHDPFGWWSILARTFAHYQGMEGSSYWHEMIGILGWLDVTLPQWFYVVATVAIALGVLEVCLSPKPPLSAGAQGMLAAAGLVAILLIFLLEYVTFTRTGAAFIVGVQGRYFLPFALLLPAALPRLPSRATARASRAIALVPIPFVLCSAVVTIVMVVRRYYI